MITKFEEGKWYRYQGVIQPNWNHKSMTFMMDGKPHKCTKTTLNFSMHCAVFEDDPQQYDWNWGNLDDFYEVDSACLFKRGDRVLVRDHDYDKWVERTFLEYQEDGVSCVGNLAEENFNKGERVSGIWWKYVKPLTDAIATSKCPFNRGERILVWDANGNNKKERVFMGYIEGARAPYVCVAGNFEKEYFNGKPFELVDYVNAEPMPPRETVTLHVECGTLGARLVTSDNKIVNYGNGTICVPHNQDGSALFDHVTLDLPVEIVPLNKETRNA